jgi:hypothetical protein
MDSWNLSSFPFPAVLTQLVAGPDAAKEASGEISSALIQIPLATLSLAKIMPASQANSPQALIADSISRNAVRFDQRTQFHLQSTRSVTRPSWIFD